MTYEKVLQVFQSYLQEDSMYEIVTTSHGYALLEWSETQEEWSNCWHLPTPEIMMERLLDSYEMYLMWQVLSKAGREELTEDEQKHIASRCELLRKMCLSN